MAHPVLYISPDTAGLIYVNGHLAGECDAAQPLVMPVAPQGALYIEYHPLRAGYMPVSRRINMAGGCIAPGSEPLEDMYIVAWPGAVIDVEITPPRIGMLGGDMRLSAGGYEVSVSAGTPVTACVMRGAPLMSLRLPEGAHGIRAMAAGEGRLMLLGRCTSGEFIRMIEPERGRALLEAAGSSITPAERGCVRVERRADDEAGHEISEIWRPGPRGYECEVLSAAASVPPRAASPLSAALMLGQAVLLGEDGEARALLSDGAQARYPGMRALISRYDGCCALKYGARGDAVGLMKLVAPGYARVHALEFDAVKGADGWLIDEVRAPGR